MTVDTASTAPALSFPPDIFAALSPAPFLLAHLSSSKQPLLRPNGRTTSTFRAPGLNSSSLTHCSGSAVVRLGDTAVVCGVRGELLLQRDVPNPPDTDADPARTLSADDEANDTTTEDEDDREELERLGLLVPNVELATGATPTIVPGQPPSAPAQVLTSRLLGLLHSTRLVRARDLRVTYTPPATNDDADDDGENKREVVAYWTLYIDIVFMSLDGNALDAAWGAMLAALRDTVLPRAWWDYDSQMVLCDDQREKARKLRLRGSPVASSFAIFAATTKQGSRGQDFEVLGLEGLTGQENISRAEDDEDDNRAWVLADPDAFEEANCREVVTVVVDKADDRFVVRRVEKHGGAVVGRDLLKSIVKRSEDRWAEWSEALGDEGR
ncbi:exoribonuclease family protein [Phyllosticta citribraziliensis]|uniref:Ribosomal RNA-processing protein 43 n=1 Tax=Phyllosticta citribraziliensis TaxID=989973 RepID=A0ABR1LP06_9PEZI